MGVFYIAKSVNFEFNTNGFYHLLIDAFFHFV